MEMEGCKDRSYLGAMEGRLCTHSPFYYTGR